MKRISYRSVGSACGIVVLMLLGSASLAGQVVPITEVPSQQAPAEEAGVYLVTFRTGTPAAERAAAVQAAGVALRRAYTSVNAASVQVPDAAALARLRNDPRVVAVFANRLITLAAPVQGNGRGGGNGGGKAKPPADLGAAALSSSEIVLSWTDGSNNETGFAVERCTGAGCGDFSEVSRIGPDSTGYTDSGLAAGTLFRYRVMAFNAAGNSKYSNTAEAETDPAPPAPAPPAAPSNLTATVDSVEILLEWSDNSDDENGFHLERCIGPLAGCAEADFVQIAQLGPDVGSHIDVGLPEMVYTYRVRAFNAIGVSAYSNHIQAVTGAVPTGPQVVPSGVSRIGAAPGTLGVTGAGVGVAVVDTGLDFGHPDLDLDPEIPGVNAFNAFGGSCQDFYGHGTHVGGTIAARDNSFDVVGVAPDATLYCVNVFIDDPVEGVIATDDSLLAGLDWIATNAGALTPPIRVVNMSLGRPWTVEDDNPLHPLRLAIEALHSGGISIVVAAGNDPLLEATQNVPAGYPEVMAVAATTAGQGINGYDDLFGPCVGVPAIPADTASFFTTDGAFIGGRGVTVSAPGEAREDIFSYLGDCYLEPVGILSTALGGGTEALYGTSMASPHVAGVVALMWETESRLGLDLDPETARDRIRSTVDRAGTAPLDSPIVEYTFDGEREGMIWAPAAVWEAPPPTPDLPPAVTIASPVSGATFGAGETIAFEGTADDPEQGDLSAGLIWTSTIDGQIGTGAAFSRTLSNGTHTIAASVTDAGGNVATDSAFITVGSSSQGSTVQISSILWSEAGSTLAVTVGLSDEFGNPVPGSLVSAEMIEWFYTLMNWPFSGTTNSQGQVQFQLMNAPIGCYLVDVQSITADGFTWVGGTPTNYYCK